MCAARLSVGSYLAAIAVAASPAAADFDLFQIELVAACATPETTAVTCVAVDVDLDCDGQLTAQDAILYADMCIAADSGATGLVYAGDSSQLRACKASAVTEAMLYIWNRPDLFEGGLGEPPETVWLKPAPCATNMLLLTGDRTPITCFGAANLAAAIGQHIGTLFTLPTDATAPAAPGNVGVGNPNIPAVRLPPEPNLTAPPIEKAPPYAPGEEPCTVPTPERMVMPGGDGPMICAGEFSGSSPCDVSHTPPEPGQPDVKVCFGGDGCTPPVVDPDVTDPYHTVPDESVCAGSNPCIPTCADMPCGESPFSLGDNPQTPCFGVCDPPLANPDPPLRPDETWSQPSGIYRVPLDLTPRQKEPTVYCGGSEADTTGSSWKGGVAGEGQGGCHPVDWVTGDKLEEETDLTVALAGRDFHLIRHYSTNPNGVLGAAADGGRGLFGAGWSSPLFQELHLDATSHNLVLRGKRPNSMGRFEKIGSTWHTIGRGTDVIEEYTEGLLTMYRVTTPGVGKTVFYGSGVYAGRVASQTDEYGNTFTFKYRRFVGDVARLHRVYLNGTSEANAAAMLEFGYYLFEDDSLISHDALVGRVARVILYRFRTVESERVPFETHRLEYTYKHLADGLSPDTGTSGDLIQVVKYSRVDEGMGAPSTVPTEAGTRTLGPGYDHRASVTQYRYHNATAKSTGDERLDVTGPAHALKSVFRPEQIEYYAELVNRDNPWLSGMAFSVRDAAVRLMMLPDDSVAVSRGSETYKVFELASKIAGYDHASPLSTRWVVVKQYLQTGGCGCGGSAQSVREEYARFEWTDGTAGRTVRINESVRTPGTPPTWTLYRRRWVDSQKIGSGDAYYGIRSVVDEPDGTPTGYTRRWITEYKYDEDTHDLIEEWTPAACADLQDDYTPAHLDGATVVAPELDGEPSGGLVRYYVYNGDHRVIEAGVRNGVTGPGATAVPVSAITYGASNTGSLRVHLPVSVEMIAGAGADGTEKVTFAYTFTGAWPVNALLAVETISEAERPAENGPVLGGGGAARTYATLALFDAQGQVTWSADELGVLTHRAFDAATGRVTQVVANADPDGMPGALRDVYDAWVTARGLAAYSGDELVSTITRDEQGRVLSVSVPGPGGDPVVEQWVYGYLRMDLPGLDERPGVPFAFYGVLPHRWTEGGTARFSGPAELIWSHAGGGTVQVSGFTLDPAETFDRLNIEDLAQTEVSRKTLRWSLPGTLSSLEAWHDLAGGLGRVSGDRSYTASFEYDARGHRSKTTSATGHVTTHEFDVLDRITGEWHGTSALDLKQTAAFYYDSTGGAAAQGVGNGNLTVSAGLTGEAGAAGTRTRVFGYDWRDRLVSVKNPLPPHAVLEHDNLGRVVGAAGFGSAAVPGSIGPSADRGSYRRYFYSQRGLLYKTAAATDPTSATPGYLESHRWFDARGATVAAWGPDSAATKAVYDRLGRVLAVYATDRGGDDAPGASGSLEDALSVTGDTVLRQTGFTYGEAGELSLVTSLVRCHDAGAGGGALSAVSTPPTGVASYSGFRYDPAGRPRHGVDFGTNKASDATLRLGDSFSNGGAPVWPPAVGNEPAWDDTDYAGALVTEVRYDGRGRVSASVDPMGRVASVRYDDLDRVIATVENATDTAGVPDVSVSWNATEKRWAVTGLNASYPDRNRVTSSAHVKVTEGGAARWRLRTAAHSAAVGGAGGDAAQVTEVVFGVTAPASPGGGDSLVASADLPGEVRFPDESTGAPGATAAYKVLTAFNRLGEPRSVTDQNGTSHAYTRDLLGRVTLDAATPGAGFSFDGRVTSISAAFDTLGRLTDVRSHGVVSGSPVVRDHVRYSYTALGLLERLTQDHDSDIDAPSGEAARKVDYAYAVAGIGAAAPAVPNTARLTGIGYPYTGASPATTLSYAYGVPGAPDETVDKAIGRVSGLTLSDVLGGGAGIDLVPVAEYTYLGLGTPAQVDFVGIDSQLDRTIDRTGRRNYGTNAALNTQDQGAYPGLDRFGRVKKQSWVKAGYNRNATTDAPNRRELAALGYAYDRAGNPVAKRIEQLGAGVNGRWADRDWSYGYDGLDRLTLATRGAYAADSGSGAFTGATLPALTQSTGSLKWSLDALGNPTEIGHDFDNAATPPAFAAGELQARGHNRANELSAGAVLPAMASAPAGSPHSADQGGFTYDDNGNRTASGWADPASTNGFKFRYTYDCWNRLTQIERARWTGASAGTGGSVGAYNPLAQYSYNGMSWRTSKLTCGRGVLGDDTAPTLKEKRLFWYDAAWRILAEDVDDDVGSASPGSVLGLATMPGVDRKVQQVFGLGGVNDAVYRREDRSVAFVAAVPPTENDPETEEDESDPGSPEVPASGPDGEYEFAFYQLADAQGSIVATVQERGNLPDGSPGAGRLRDEVEYGPYGRSRRFAQGDFDRDGAVQVAVDIFAFLSAAQASPPSPAGDEDDNGSVSVVTDLFAWLGEANTGDSSPRQLVSAYTVDNPYGYCGYYQDAETGAARVLGPSKKHASAAADTEIDGPGCLYQVRHRVYDPFQARWLTRDPAGFVDGMNLYQYCGSGPVGCFDPFGLCSDGDSKEWNHGAPQKVFLNKDGTPKYPGVNVNEKEYGRVMTRDEHRGGAHTGEPSNKQIHDDYVKHWEQWVEQQKAQGKAITRDSVLGHLAEIEANKGGQYDQFAGWLGDAVQAEHSYGEWKGKSAAAREAWYAGKISEARAVARTAVQELRAAATAADRAAAVNTAMRGLKGLGFLAMAYSLFANVEAVRAGEKSGMEGVHDTLNPLLEIQDIRALQTIIESKLDGSQGNYWLRHPRHHHTHPAPMTPGEAPDPIREGPGQRGYKEDPVPPGRR